MDESIQQIIRDGLLQNLSLSQIQQNLADAGENMTYMQLRLLVDDLGLTLPSKTSAQPPSPATAVESTSAEPTPGPFQMSADPVMRPGALMSGSVSFTDGTQAQWSVDQMGRLGLSGAPSGYRPSPEDISLMQQRLRELIENKSLS